MMNKSVMWRQYVTILRILSICLPWSWASFGLADELPTRISFQNIMENKDITLGQGGAIFQDSEGFMWFGGTNALLRYDGYEFRQMDAMMGDQGHQKKEPVKTVQDIVEDSKQRLWISTRAGLYVYDSQLGLLTKVKDDPSQSVKITTTVVMRAKEIPTGEIVAATLTGIFVVDPNTLSYTVITADTTKENWLTSNKVNAIYVDNSGTIWFGTDEGLEKVNWSRKYFSLYKINIEHPDWAADNRVVDLVPAGDGAFWLGTANGLVHYNPQTRESKRYVHELNNPFSLGANDIWRLLIDSHGVLWIALDGGGLAVLDEERNRFINHQHEPGRAGSISSNQVRTVYEDRSGDIWSGNYPVGINYFDRSTSSINSYARDISNPRTLSHNSVLGIAEDLAGNLWLGTDGGGLSVFDRKTGLFENYLYDPSNPNSIPGKAINAVFIDSKGLVWLGFWADGLASFDPKTKAFTRYPHNGQHKNTARVSTSMTLNSEHVWSIREDVNSNMWITTHTGGISRYDRTTKVFTHYAHIEGDAKSISNNSAWTSLRDSNGNFWVCTNTGLNLMNVEDGTFTQFTNEPGNPSSLSSPNAITIFEDSRKRLWVGTSAGLNLFDLQSKTFTSYTTNNGFLNDFIRTITEDVNGNLWISTNNGFASFNPDTLAIKNYNRIAGRLTLGFFKNSGLTSRKGEILLGGINGLRIFNPANLIENKTIPQIAITDFKIFSDSVAVGEPDGILTRSINKTETITLDYTKSMFSFGFAALNFKDPSKNRYSYTLEGFDDHWLDAGDQRVAKYTNLNPGQYRFKVRGSNNDGLWSQDGKSITVIQLPPPWKSWWAYTLYLFTLLGIIAWFVHQQKLKRKAVEQQNKILEIKVNERTAEVRAKSKDIRAMLTNIPQGLFTIHQERVIHPEYSSHLETIFETTKIAGRQAADLLFANALLGADVIETVKSAIFAMVGEDEMNYDFNRFSLIPEYQIQIGSRIKHLSLDWNPIVEDGLVVKLMVSVRDVTHLKLMEEQARDQKRQLEIVGQLLDLTADKYLAFEESSIKYVAACRAEIEAASERAPAVIALLFRNMHTIKGNSRIYGFTHISNTAHEIETIFSALKSDQDAEWDPASLLLSLDLMDSHLAEYAHVYRSILGRGEGNGADRHDGFWMHNAVMRKIHEYVALGDLDDLRLYLSLINANTIEQDLVDIITSLSSIASQLDKKTPVVSVLPNRIRIKVTAQELVKDVFAHVLRNCVDHGLEATDERVRLEKNIHGLITITPVVGSRWLTITVRDDGRGLSIKKLFTRGLSLGKWNERDTPGFQEVADLIFCSGVSTKEVVTEISGRGVGLDAVRQFLKEVGGDVSIRLLSDCVNLEGCIDFELALHFPSDLFFEADDEGLPIQSTI